LNRGIGLCKKSSSKLPVDDSHIDFIIKMVLQKYVYDENERETKHLFNCIKHGIPFFVTTNAGLIERFYENRSLLLNNPLFSIGKIDVLSPLDFEGRLAEDIIE